MIEEPRRRVSDRREGAARPAVDRRWHDRRTSGRRFPTWRDQRVQFAVRYVFLILGVVFFNFSAQFKPVSLTLPQLNVIFAGYFLFNTLALLHARRSPEHAPRYRLAMWVDTLLATVCVVQDPYAIPPSLLVFIMVALGNGMRYGMRMFGESLSAAFAGAMLALSLRYAHGQGVSAGLVFLNLFGGIILAYAYTLMNRIERSQLRLEAESTHDALTGLLNRRALFEQAPALLDALPAGETAVVMFADLDKFKAINDTLGHARGDEALQGVADILQACTQEPDLVARLGGDEFVMVLPATTIDQARQLARRVREQTDNWARKAGLDLGVSFGLGEAPTHGRDLASLLDQVDQAMYRAKSDPEGISVVEAA